MFRVFYLLAGLLLFNSCVSLKTVSLTEIPQNRSKVVQSKGGSWTFLGIAFSNSFADSVVEDLKKQCPNGQIKGILTKYQLKVYFLIIKREVVAKGFCE